MAQVTVMPLANLSIVPGSNIYYDQDFRNVLESYLPYLRTVSTSSVLVVDRKRVIKYQFDFYGFLSTYQVPPFLQWLTMRMNFLTSPQDDFQYLIGDEISAGSIVIPDMQEVNKIATSYQTVARIS